jgi:hypothetical protein
MEKTINNLPPQMIRDAIIEVLSSFNSSLTIDELESYVSESLEVSSINTTEELTYFHKIMKDMVLGDKIEIKDKSVHLSPNEINEITDYSPLTLELKSNNVLDVDGSLSIFSVGSQYYGDAWDELESGELIPVELVLEDNNPYDKNAIAVVYNKQILGHLTRSDAQEYHSILKMLEEYDITISIKAVVESVADKQGYKYLKLLMPAMTHLSTLL